MEVNQIRHTVMAALAIAQQLVATLCTQIDTLSYGTLPSVAVLCWGQGAQAPKILPSPPEFFLAPMGIFKL